MNRKQPRQVVTASGGFPGGSVVKNPPDNAGDAGDTGLTPRSGRSPRGGYGNPLQYSCLESPMDRGAWRATVHGVAELDTTEQLSMRVTASQWTGRGNLTFFLVTHPSGWGLFSDRLASVSVLTPEAYLFKC